MNIAVLGGGVEGNAVKNYFTEKGDHVQVFDKFEDKDIFDFKLDDYDLIFRSPSVHPWWLLEKFGAKPNADTAKWTSATRYFFENCPAPIIGVTGTKGKGTTCSLIVSILKEIVKSSDWKSREVHLVGNIGLPAISVLDKISPDDIVVYEMSSFQLWDLADSKISPRVAVVGRIEADHLDRHFDFDDYVAAKSNITRCQTSEDSCIFYGKNQFSKEISQLSSGTKIEYTEKSVPAEFLNFLSVPGDHNRENAAAAILAVAAFFRLPLANFLDQNREAVANGLKNFKGLPHRIEFIRDLNGVKYYDDNYSAAFPAMDVAIKTFENHPTYLIAGGKDRHLDLSQHKNRLFSAPNLKKIFLIGETKAALSEGEDPEKYILCETLEEAVTKAQLLAEKCAADQESNYDLCIPSTSAAKSGQKNPEPIVLMSPGAASFDMFKNFGDRGDQFQCLVKNLK